MSKNNRSCDRHLLEQAVRIRFDGDIATVSGCLVNISEGGAFIRCSVPVEVGRVLKCAFLPPRGGPQDVEVCRATVRWVPGPEVRRRLGPGFGIEFVEPRPATRPKTDAMAEGRDCLKSA